MTHATLSRDAHLETVIEFELQPEPADAPPRDLSRRVVLARRFAGIAGATLGTAVFALVASGIATGGAPSPSPAPAAHPTAVSSCRSVGEPPPSAADTRAWCAWPAPESPSAEVAARAARDAAVARARVWVQTHGPGSGGYRTWGSSEPDAAGQRMGSP
ncbi:hypothetical protein [Cellulomonas sp. ICMP 17802]|uniref:hypothetical protein n=1 Tax=Cellulomonas sp. ICMP 17802 TaxID=3239199 RepID=UPI00351B556D